MGKKGNLRKKKGMLLAELLLLCAFLTGCSLLDIKDGGLGMTNPDYVEPEDDGTDEDKPEMAQFKKDPVKALEKVLGVDLPDDVINGVIAGVKAKLTSDKLSDALGALKKLF